MMREQGVEVAEDLCIFRPGKSVIFGFMRHWAALIGMNGGPPKRLYPDSALQCATKSTNLQAEKVNFDWLFGLQL